MNIGKKIRQNYGILLILTVATLLLLYNISKPFIGHHDWNGVFWGDMARNYLRGNFIFFNHYTLFMPILFTLSSWVFGVNEVSLRIVTVVFSVFMIFYIYRIGKLLYSKNTGLVAAIIAMFTPMYLYFGKLPDHEPIVTSLCTMTFYYYLTFKKSSGNRLLFFALLLFSLLESWGGFFFLAVLILHMIITKRLKTRFIILSFALGIFVILFHLTLILLIQGKESILGLLRYGIWRMNMDKSEENIIRFSLKQFFATEARFMVVYYTRLLLFLSSLFLIRLFLKFKKTVAADKNLFILFLYGTFFIMVFRNLAFIHDYKLYLLLPFMSLSSAQMLNLIIIFTLKKFKSGFIIRNTKIISVITIIIFVLSVAYERAPFLITQQKTSFNTPGYMLGNLIREKTAPLEKTLILSREFDNFYGVFTLYYADRKIASEDVSFSKFQKSQDVYSRYKFIVIIDGRPVDTELANYLKYNYKSEKRGPFTFIDMDNKRVV